MRIPSIGAFFLVWLVGLHCAADAEPDLMPADNMAQLCRLRPGRTMRSSSSDANWRNGNGDARRIQPGETLAVAELEGPGIIRHFWNTIMQNELGYPRLVVLRMYWDGEEQPSVDCPLGDFFGVGHGADRAFTSAPVSVSSDGRARNCYWPMPFRKSARITVTNESTKPVWAFFWYIDWQKVPELGGDIAYFHAMYRQEHPALMGRNYLIADIRGRGHYVGTVLSVRQRQPGWWGEGDDFFFIDGEKEPSLRGTGSEDYFCDAWGLRLISYPYYGVTVYEGGQPYSRTTCYRWHIPDPVSFERSLRVEIEHKGQAYDDEGRPTSGFEERADDFSSVAFWYQVEPHKAFDPLPPGYDRVYHNPDDLTEAEHGLDRIEISGGTTSRQAGPWSGGAQVFWTVFEAGQTLVLPFEVAEEGPYEITIYLCNSWDYGIVQPELDGKALGKPLDLYHPSVITREYLYAPRTLPQGKHTLTFRNAGRNSLSRGYFLGIDCLLISGSSGNTPGAAETHAN